MRQPWRSRHSAAPPMTLTWGKIQLANAPRRCVEQRHAARPLSRRAAGHGRAAPLSRVAPRLRPRPHVGNAPGRTTSAPRLHSSPPRGGHGPVAGGHWRHDGPVVVDHSLMFIHVIHSLTFLSFKNINCLFNMIFLR